MAITFIKFILKCKNDNTAYGDVARDVFNDKNINNKWGYNQLIQHLKQMNACESVFYIIEEMYLKYRGLSAITPQNYYLR